MSELWEIVRADELKVGDVVLDLRGGAIDSYEIGPELVEIAKNSPKNFYPPKLRRIPDTEDPRVLSLAMKLMEDTWLQGLGLRNRSHYLDQARRELESEAGNGS